MSPTIKEISRTTYDIFGVFGYVGGISSIFAAVASLILIQYSKLSFQIEAFEKLMKVEMRRIKNINIFTKFRILFKINPKKRHVKLVEEHVPKLEQNFDLLIIINKLQKFEKMIDKY